MTTLTNELIANLSIDALQLMRRDLREKFEASIRPFPTTTLEEAKRKFSDDLCKILEDISDAIVNWESNT